MTVTYNISFAKRLLLFALITLLGFVITSVIAGFVMLKHPDSAPAMRICTVLQDIMLFILPALLCAVISTRYPARMLAVDSRPSRDITLWGLVAFAVSIPAMNMIVVLNDALTLPESLAGIEQMMRSYELSARHSIELIMGAHTVPALILSILLIGVLAGFSEEIFFRGGLQRLLVGGHVNPHIAIWLTAFIFSAVHMQIFGFVPRMLLGAFFGYALWWSGSLWLPILLHVTNNTVYILVDYFRATPQPASPMEIPGDAASWLFATASLILTVAAIMRMRRLRVK